MLAKQHAPVVDPFASLASPVRQSTPQSSQPSIFDFANPKPATPAVVPSTPANDDDEWAFSSALPEGQASNTIIVSQTSLGIKLDVTREPANPSVITLSLSYSNNGDQEISGLEFLAAAPKVRAHS